jgi:creatinine amidohydrolase
MVLVREGILYYELTWPEVKEAAERGRVPLLPVGSIEQHGPHLPLVTDIFLAYTICVKAAEKAPEDLLVMSPICYGYSEHHMDFPGTISINGDHFMNYVYDVCRSLSCHGFKRIIILNGHGGNIPFLDVVVRRLTNETSSIYAMVPWWNLVLEEASRLRESEFPGGMAHSGELETSVMLYLKPESVHLDRAVKDIGFQRSEFIWFDLMKRSPVYFSERFSRVSKTGTIGDPTVATAEKGRRILEAAVNNLVNFAREFKVREIPPRVDHH